MLDEFHYVEGMDEKTCHKDILGLTAWDPAPVWKQSASFVFNIVYVLCYEKSTSWNGENAVALKASLAKVNLGEVKKNMNYEKIIIIE